MNIDRAPSARLMVFITKAPEPPPTTTTTTGLEAGDCQRDCRNVFFTCLHELLPALLSIITRLFYLQQLLRLHFINNTTTRL